VTTISVDMIKKLRDATQVSMMDCKKALIEANGDFDKAVEFLRKKGISVAAKRAENATNNGTINAIIAPDFRSGALVEVACETDFSANTADMRSFAQSIGSQVLVTEQDTATPVSDAQTIATFMEKPLAGHAGETPSGLLATLVAKIAENIKVSRFVKMTTANGIINGYCHGSTLGILVELDVDGTRPADITPLVNAAKDVAMQIAVTNPLCVSSNQLDPAVVAKEAEIYAEQLRAEGKNPQMIEKIVPGKLNKFYESACLNNQKFIKDDKQTVQQMLDAAGKTAGCSVRVARFVRFAIGQ